MCVVVIDYPQYMSTGLKMIKVADAEISVTLVHNGRSYEIRDIDIEGKVEGSRLTSHNVTLKSDLWQQIAQYAMEQKRDYLDEKWVAWCADKDNRIADARRAAGE
jgi:hypothetical protein